MPYINIYAFSGRDMEMKKKTARAIVKAAAEAMEITEDRFTVYFNDVEKENWDKEVEPIFEPLKENMLLENGELL